LKLGRKKWRMWTGAT